MTRTVILDEDVPPADEPVDQFASDEGRAPEHLHKCPVCGRPWKCADSYCVEPNLYCAECMDPPVPLVFESYREKR